MPHYSELVYRINSGYVGLVFSKTTLSSTVYKPSWLSKLGSRTTRYGNQHEPTYYVAANRLNSLALQAVKEPHAKKKTWKNQIFLFLATSFFFSIYSIDGFLALCYSMFLLTRTVPAVCQLKEVGSTCWHCISCSTSSTSRGTNRTLMPLANNLRWPWIFESPWITKRPS